MSIQKAHEASTELSLTKYKNIYASFTLTTLQGHVPKGVLQISSVVVGENCS